MSTPLLLGIDLGGTNCRGALVEPDGQILARRRMTTNGAVGKVDLLRRLSDFCTELIADAASLGRNVATLGIGVPGVVDAAGRVVVAPNLSALDSVPLAALLREHLLLPVVVCNDANAAAWGESRLGAGRGFDSFLALTLGTGIGGGLILNRCLWSGADGAAGEVGHLAVEPDGRLCGCGKRGCLETYASAGGVVCNLTEALAAGMSSPLAGLPAGELDAARIAAAARTGDAVAAAALARAGGVLGRALGDILSLLNLDGVVIGGGLAASLDLFLPALQQALREHAFVLAAKRCRVVPGLLGDDAGILGAALLAVDATGDLR